MRRDLDTISVWFQVERPSVQLETSRTPGRVPPPSGSKESARACVVVRRPGCCSLERMRPTVLDEGRQFDRQTHAYAEYRVFSRLTNEGHRSPGDVTVTLTRLDSTGSDEGPVMCSIALTTDSGRVAEVKAFERHPYAAIDRAAALIARALQQDRPTQRFATAAGAVRRPGARRRDRRSQALQDETPRPE